MTHRPSAISPRPAPKGGLSRLLARIDDGDVVRVAFMAMLAGAAAVIGLDLKQLSDEHGGLWSSPASAVEMTEPVLPPAVEVTQGAPASSDPRRHLRDTDDLKGAIRFELEPGGVLTARGSIDVGAAGRFEAEIEARGEYVRTVALNSPGGSLDDAMAMARLIRERGLSTSVPDGALCASSCPLVLAGGTSRSVGDEAAIGLHQFYSGTSNASAPAQAMSDAQVTAARISRYLSEMGVEPAMWLHALDTPPRALYYLSPQEMAEYRLVTGIGPMARR